MTALSKKFKATMDATSAIDVTTATIATFNKLAQPYQDKYMDLADYDDTYDIFCSHLPRPDAEVLELACGPGNVTRALLRRLPGLKILATDLAPQMVELARINNPGASVKLMDSRDFISLQQQFDAIVCAFGLPYLSADEAAKLIADASQVLTAGGLLYLSTMEGDPSQSAYQTSSSGDQVYIHYHRAPYLLAALAQHGFTLLDLRRKPGPVNASMPSTDLFLIARRAA